MAPEELVLVSRAVARRRAEFAAGRRAARRSLLGIGRSAAMIGRGSRGEPVWPAGVTGSISHAGGVAAAIAAPLTESGTYLGLDLEAVGAVREELWSVLFSEAEMQGWPERTARIATVAFAAKEAGFKALYPAVGLDPDPRDAHLRFLVDDEVAIDVSGAASPISARWQRAGDLLVVIATYRGGRAGS